MTETLAPARPAVQSHADRLAALRAELKARGLDGFVIPISDEHMSEYVAGYAQRLAWLTGFGGSAGTAVVLADRAAIFADGRYTIQVRDQVDGAPVSNTARSRPNRCPPGWRNMPRPGREDRLRSLAAWQALGRCLR